MPKPKTIDSTIWIEASAEFSPCKQYRYRLVRSWCAEKPMLAIIGLNPSTADEKQLDPTLRKCVKYAKAWGFGKLTMLNIFAFRSTDPYVLAKKPWGFDLVGPDNDFHIADVASKAKMVLAAWGTHAWVNGRERHALKLLTDRGITLHHLGRTKAGFPRHPLYVLDSMKPIEWDAQQIMNRINN